MRSGYLLIDIIISLLFSGLLIAAMTNGGHRRRLNRRFAYLTMCLIVWMFALHISNDTSLAPSTAIIADYIVFGASFGAMVASLGVVVELSRSTRSRRHFDHWHPLLWTLALVFATPLVARDVVLQEDSYAVVFGPLVGLYIAAVVVIMTIVAAVSAHALQTMKGTERQRFSIVSSSFIVSATLIILVGFVIPAVTGNYDITSFSLWPAFIMIVALYYSVIRHRLFDIRFAVMRTTTYALSIITMAIMYFSLAYVLSVTIFHDNISTGLSISPVNIFMALVLALVFQPVKHFFDRLTDKFFYRGSYDQSEFIIELGRVLTSTTDVNELMARSTDLIQKTFKSLFVKLVVFGDEMTVATAGKAQPALENDRSMELRDWLVGARGRVCLVDQTPHDLSLLHRALKKRRAVLLLPLEKSDDLVGYVVLGEQLGAGYTRRDMQTLEAIADELVIALENARSVREVQDLNEHLQSRIDSATRELRKTNKRLLELDAVKDEFVSMASHQLRTPLTSVKGYLSMVLEGDVGEVTPDQRQLLEEAFTSSERMVHLIGDFLNVSRLQTGKFIIDRREIDLAHVVAQEVEGMRQIAATHGVKLEYHVPKRFPMLYLDENKLRQVIMNFIDNAIYYSPDGRLIKITLTVEDGDAVLRVVDQGMGVPAEVQSRLFTKFFRAENARKQRPDGTGIGLYLAKQIIDGHRGALVFESTLGKGSTFGFRLPIKRLSRPPKPTEEETAKTVG
jgi:signal transduction histidine kinase